MATLAIELGRLLYEARTRAAWGEWADHRMTQFPFPRHEAEVEMPEVCWLAIQEAKAVLKAYALTPLPTGGPDRG